MKKSRKRKGHASVLEAKVPYIFQNYVRFTCREELNRTVTNIIHVMSTETENSRQCIEDKNCNIFIA
jgi:hypothetical protein